MAGCEYIDVCDFFNDESGYSPEMMDTMKQLYCFSNNAGCARLLALNVCCCAEAVPADLIPSDTSRLEQMRLHQDPACHDEHCPKDAVCGDCRSDSE